MNRLTIRDVAERAGVSLGTVSNVLNRPELVADSTRDRVLAAIEEIGFVRNGAARQLRGGKGLAIGLVVLDINNPFFTEIARSVEDAATEADHLVILCNSAGIEEREERHLLLLEEQRVAGILITPVAKMPSLRLRQMRSRGTAVVLLDRRSPRRDQCSVAVDDVSGGRLAADHLVSLGHRRVGLINGPRSIQQCADRRIGFLGELSKRGLALAPADDVETDTMTINAGMEAAASLFERRSRPAALFCGNDLLAIGAQHAALTRGLRVPDDVAIVGYDDVQFAAMSFVPLTSVRQPTYELGYRAAKLLLDEANNGAHHHHERLLFEPELVIRESTVGDGLGAAAVATEFSAGGMRTAR